jgi:hypothetical protein
MIEPKEYLEIGMKVMRDHANEDYNTCYARNNELTGLAMCIGFASETFGPLTMVTKESIVAAYLLGRADERDANDYKS